MAVRWDIRRNGRSWVGDEFPARWELTPEKLEVIDGKLLWGENDRLNLVAILIENLGVDTVVRLGGLEVWEAALAASRGQPRELISRRLDGWEEGYEGEYPLGSAS